MPAAAVITWQLYARGGVQSTVLVLVFKLKQIVCSFCTCKKAGIRVNLHVQLTAMQEVGGSCAGKVYRCTVAWPNGVVRSAALRLQSADGRLLTGSTGWREYWCCAGCN